MKKTATDDNNESVRKNKIKNGIIFIIKMWTRITIKLHITSEEIVNPDSLNS